MKYQIIKLNDNPAYLERAVDYFHHQWKIPKEVYKKSMQASLSGQNIPQWYLVIYHKQMIGGAGVIANDFHERVDLTPNVCAVCVDEKYRNQGIAGELLQFICNDFVKRGIDTLYLVSDHDGFYERYGWEHIMMVQGEKEEHLTKMYRHVDKGVKIDE